MTLVYTAFDSFKEDPESVRSHVPGLLARIECSLNPSGLPLQAKSGPWLCSTGLEHIASADFKPHFTLACIRNSCRIFLSGLKMLIWPKCETTKVDIYDRV